METKGSCPRYLRLNDKTYSYATRGITAFHITN